MKILFATSEAHPLVKAGDRVVAVRDAFVGEDSPALAHAGSFRLPPQDIGGNISTVVTGQCSIQAVYPVHS